MQYRKRPVVIDAIQWTGGNGRDIADFLGNSEWEFAENDVEIKIHTLEGTMSAFLDDWVIKGVQGEFYPCKPDIFEQTYEEVG